MAIKTLFEMKSFVGARDASHQFVYMMDQGMTITVNSGDKDRSRAAAHLLASAFKEGGSKAMRSVADSQVNSATRDNQPFVCKITSELVAA